MPRKESQDSIFGLIQKNLSCSLEPTNRRGVRSFSGYGPTRTCSCTVSLALSRRDLIALRAVAQKARSLSFSQDNSACNQALVEMGLLDNVKDLATKVIKMPVTAIRMLAKTAGKALAKALLWLLTKAQPLAKRILRDPPEGNLGDAILAGTSFGYVVGLIFRVILALSPIGKALVVGGVAATLAVKGLPSMTEQLKESKKMRIAVYAAWIKAMQNLNRYLQESEGTVSE